MKPTPTRAQSDFGMAASGSPEATAAAVEILERGGNAVDAAVAAALMLGVSDPDASGLGGMTSMIIRLADGHTVVIDGAAPTPRGVDPTRLRPFEKDDWRVGHWLVAVPTTLAVLERARSRYGSMALRNLLAPAIEVAERENIPHQVTVRRMGGTDAGMIHLALPQIDGANQRNNHWPARRRPVPTGAGEDPPVHRPIRRVFVLPRSYRRFHRCRHAAPWWIPSQGRSRHAARQGGTSPPHHLSGS